MMKKLLLASGAFAASFAIAFSLLSFLDWQKSVGDQLSVIQSAIASGDH